MVWESFHRDDDDEDDPCEGILGMSKQECTLRWMDGQTHRWVSCFLFPVHTTGKVFADILITVL